MNRTRILVGLLVMVILMQLFPEKAAAIEKAAIVGGGLYFLAWAALRFLAQHNRRRAEAAQSAADEAEYQAALAALHDKHQDMLARKFGPR